MDLQPVASHDPSAVTDEEREAAVFVPVIERTDGEHVLFTKRADHLPDHPGQMSFPGGGREPADEDLLATALREANEEIGLHPDEPTVVGRLDDIRTVTGYSVRPYVVVVPDRRYHPSDEEVAEIAVLPLAGLTDPDNYESERRDHPDHGEILLHYFHVDGYTVWGATARIFVQFLELATDWEVPREVDGVLGEDGESAAGGCRQPPTTGATAAPPERTDTVLAHRATTDRRLDGVGSRRERHRVIGMLTGATLADAGIDGVALKPTEVDVTRASDLGVDAVTIDYEGNRHVPSPDVLADLAGTVELRVTAPVRADGFDPLGEDALLADLPPSVGTVLVAGNPAYLTDEERARPIAPRLHAAAADAADPWIGTEGIERLALSVGGTQFELLSATTARDVRSLREAGFDGEIAVYAPTVLSEDESSILDGVGEYVSRRRAVAELLPDGITVDADLSGRPREVLLRSAGDYALVGSPETVADRVRALREAGADTVVAYPARGLDALFE